MIIYCTAYIICIICYIINRELNLIQDMLFPLLWLEESAQINDKGMATFKVSWNGLTDLGPGVHFGSTSRNSARDELTWWGSQYLFNSRHFWHLRDCLTVSYVSNSYRVTDELKP